MSPVVLVLMMTTLPESLVSKEELPERGELENNRRFWDLRGVQLRTDLGFLPCSSSVDVLFFFIRLEDSLRLGEKNSYESYTIELDSPQNPSKKLSNYNSIEPTDVEKSELHANKKLKSSPNNSESSSPETKDKSLSSSKNSSLSVVTPDA